MDAKKISKLVEIEHLRHVHGDPVGKLGEQRKTLWVQMTGGEQAAALKKSKEQQPSWEKEKEQVLKTITEKKPTTTNSKGEKKELPAGATPLDPTEAKGKKEPKPKKEPVVITYNWLEKHDDVGRRVFTPNGTAVVLAIDVEKHAYKVRLESDGTTEKVISQKSVRFKAFNEEFRDKYETDKTVRTASGAYSVSNGDEIAKALNGLTVESLANVASRAGLTERWVKWEHVNPGMQRMNLSNVMRGVLKEGSKSDEATQKRVSLALDFARKEKRPEPPKKVMTDEQKAKLKAGKAKPTAQEAVAASSPVVAKVNAAPDKGSAAKVQADKNAKKPEPKGKQIQKV